MCLIIRETCEAVSKVLAKDYLKAPPCPLDWEGISREFEMRRVRTSLQREVARSMQSPTHLKYDSYI